MVVRFVHMYIAWADRLFHCQKVQKSCVYGKQQYLDLVMVKDLQTAAVVAASSAASGDVRLGTGRPC